MANMNAKDIIEKLKPNAYVDNHSIWERVEKSLNKLTKKDRNDLWIVVACKREK